MRHPLYLLVGSLALLALSKPAHAAQSYDNCTGTIASLPAVISTPGTWCLKSDLATAIASGTAITINSNNVTLDCNDFHIHGTAGLATAAFAIKGTDRVATRVRHCQISGFYYGLELIGAGGGSNLVEDNMMRSNTFIGIRVEGDGSVVRRNQISDTGGSTARTNAFGIYTTYSVDVLDNTIAGVFAASGSGGKVVGIETVNHAGSVTGNRIRGLVKDGAGTIAGIYNAEGGASSGRVLVRDNDIVGDASSGSVGVRCTDNTGRVKDNFIAGFALAIDLCGDGGGNDISL